MFWIPYRVSIEYWGIKKHVEVFSTSSFLTTVYKFLIHHCESLYNDKQNTISNGKFTELYPLTLLPSAKTSAVTAHYCRRRVKLHLNEHYDTSRQHRDDWEGTVLIVVVRVRLAFCNFVKVFISKFTRRLTICRIHATKRILEVNNLYPYIIIKL